MPGSPGSRRWRGAGAGAKSRGRRRSKHSWYVRDRPELCLPGLSLQLVTARFFKEIDNLRASEKLAAVYDPGRDIIRIARTVFSSLTADRKLDLAVNHGAPLALVAMRGQINIL